MNARGIVRRVDDLGRVVIPKELRRAIRVKEGDPLEIFVDREGQVVLRKYSPVSELGDFAREYADSLHETTGHICLITDNDFVIAVSGGNKREYLGKPIGKAVEGVIKNRAFSMIDIDKPEDENCFVIQFEGREYDVKSQVIVPIICQGDILGTVILMSKYTNMGELEYKLTATAADFLAKQMEV